MDGMRVLVVEDEVIISELMAEALTDKGFAVDEAADGNQVRRLVEADGYKLVVTDLHMPGAPNGLELATEIKAQDPTLPVLLITGRPDVLKRLASRNLPIAVLAKPFTPAKLVAVVKEMVGRP